MTPKTPILTADQGDCAVLHDFMLVNGGAEHLVDCLAISLRAHLVVGFSCLDEDSIASKTAGRLLVLGASPRGRLARYLVSARRFSRIDPQILQRAATIYSGVIAPLAVHRQTEGKKIYYCHSPPRFLYDLKPYYRERSGWYGRLALAMLDRWLRPRYERAVRAMDRVVANSENVRQRLKYYLGVDAVVIHPPIDTDRYQWIEQGEYFLSTARLEDFKRVELIVEVFKKMPDRQLVVASGGSQEAALRKLATECPNIRFTSWISDREMAELVGRCRAVIYIPIDEDFGMSPVEAMAAGKPVIGVAEGGLLETVIDGETGILLNPSHLTPTTIAEAVMSLCTQEQPGLRAACEARARSFARQRFIEKMEALLLPIEN